MNGVLMGVGACAPERIPGSSVEQGDAGVAFRRAANAATGSGAAISTASRARTSVPYGGGSSSSPKRSVVTTGASAQRAAVIGCDWFSVPGGATAPAPSGWDRTKGIGMEGWFAANCIGRGELR